MNVEEELRLLAKTGKYMMGTKETIKEIMHGRAKLVLLAKNCPREKKESAKYYAKLAGIKVEELDMDVMELASLFGRPHPIAMLAVLDQGSSKVFEIFKVKT